MLLDNIILPGVVYPTTAAIVALAFSLFFGRGGATGRSGASFSIGTAFATGFVALNGWPRIPPVEATQRLAVLASLIALAALIASLVRPPEGTRKLRFASDSAASTHWGIVVAAVLAALAASVAILEVLIRNSWSSLQSALWILALATLAVLLWHVLRAHLLALPSAATTYPGQRDALSRIALRLLTLSLLSAVYGLAESALIGQLMGALVCGVAVVDLAGWTLRRRFWRDADLALLLALLIGLGLIAHHYAGLTPAPALLVVGALLLLPGTQAKTLRSLAPAVLLVAAIGLLLWAKANAPEDPYDDYGATDSLDVPARRASAGLGDRFS